MALTHFPRPPRSSGSRTELSDGTLIKTLPPVQAAEEVARCRIGAEIGRQSGLFYVPEIHAFEADLGKIHFEYLHGLRPYRQLLGAETGRLDWLARAAAILAAIHNAKTDAGDPQPFFHGDFSLDNLQYDPMSDRAVLLDWGTAHWVRNPLDWNGWQIDVAIMTISIFLRRPFEADRVPQPEASATAFLRAYAGQAGRALDPEEFKRLFTALRHDFLLMPGGAWSRLKVWLRMASLMRATSFVRQL